MNRSTGPRLPSTIDPRPEEDPIASVTGHAAQPPETREHLSRGRISFRLDGDEISEVALDGTVLLETLRPALRDRDWGTVEPRTLHEEREEGPGTLTRRLEAAYDGADGEARAVSTLRVDEEGLRLRYEVTAVRALTTNRVGLTAMLPRAFAGDDATVRTPDGQERRFRFPRPVAPWQPLFDIRSLDLLHRGRRARLRLDGDVFEMEDQRNWTDASYKIYSRPLAMPFPYRLEAGKTVVQEIELTALGAVPDASPAPARGAAPARAPAGTAPQEDVVDLGALLASAPTLPLPRIGVGATTGYGTPTNTPGAPATSALEDLDHLMVELSDRYDRAAVLRAAAAESAATGLPVDLRVIGTESTDLSAVLEDAEAAGLDVRRVGLVDEARHVTTAPLRSRLEEAASRGADIVVGARTHFTELNREHAAIPRDVPEVAFASTPQMHQRESWHVVESVAALRDTLRSAAALHPGARLHLGPVTLRPRVNAVATRAELVDRDDDDGYGAHLTPGATDPRGDTPWAGAWLAAVLATAGAEGIRTVTALEVSGPRGVLRESGPSPAGEVLRLFARWSGEEARVLTELTGPGTAAVLHAEELLLVNARLAPLTVMLPGPLGNDRITLDPGTITLRPAPTAR